jgi:hypothetical protein
MNSKFFLTIADKEIHKDFMLKRNLEVTIISSCLLASRFIFGFVLIVAYINGKVSERRLGL